MIKATNENRLEVMGIVLLMLFGILFVGRGFSGMYLIDFDQQDCEDDSDCRSGVCCDFYKESSGVCDLKENCNAIEQITKEEKEKISSNLGLEADFKFSEGQRFEATKLISSHLEKPMNGNSYPSIIVGAILLSLSIIWIIYLKKE